MRSAAGLGRARGTNITLFLRGLLKFFEIKNCYGILFFFLGKFLMVAMLVGWLSSCEQLSSVSDDSLEQDEPSRII